MEKMMMGLFKDMQLVTKKLGLVDQLSIQVENLQQAVQNISNKQFDSRNNGECKMVDRMYEWESSRNRSDDYNVELENIEEIERNKDLHLNGCPDEEEAAVLCSLGWDGNAGDDDGLIGEEINACEEQEEKVESENVVLEDVSIFEGFKVFDNKPHSEQEEELVSPEKFLETDFTWQFKRKVNSRVYISLFDIVRNDNKIRDFQDDSVGNLGTEYEVFKNLFGHDKNLVPGCVYLYESHLIFKTSTGKNMIWLGVKKGCYEMSRYKFDPGGKRSKNWKNVNHEIFLSRLIEPNFEQQKGERDLADFLIKAVNNNRAWQFFSKDLLASCGLDIVVFTRVISFSLKIFCVAEIFRIFVLIPVGYSGKQLAELDFENLTDDFLDMFTVSDVNNDSNKCWIHLDSSLAMVKSVVEKHLVTVFGWAANDTSGVMSPFEFSRRETGEDDVRFKVLFCCICHSDLHNTKNEWSISRHEIVGIATKVGIKVIKNLGADLFWVSTTQFQAAIGILGGTIGTVSANQALQPLIGLLKTGGKIILVGPPVYLSGWGIRRQVISCLSFDFSAYTLRTRCVFERVGVVTNQTSMELKGNKFDLGGYNSKISKLRGSL